jgi:hypothetical protein
MRLMTALIVITAIALVFALRSDGHLVVKPVDRSREAIHLSQTENLYHARYVCRRGGGQHRAWACKAATGWLLREWRETAPPRLPSISEWARKQMRVAELIGRQGDRDNTDPWPNCNDPYDHRGHSWWDTVKCENTAFWQIYGDERVWLDPPGFYRCGLQFDPMWEREYGRLCP